MIQKLCVSVGTCVHSHVHWGEAVARGRLERPALPSARPAALRPWGHRALAAHQEQGVFPPLGRLGLTLVIHGPPGVTLG